jgi:hypothetical protein
MMSRAELSQNSALLLDTMRPEMEQTMTPETKGDALEQS